MGQHPTSTSWWGSLENTISGAAKSLWHDVGSFGASALHGAATFGTELLQGLKSEAAKPLPDIARDITGAVAGAGSLVGAVENLPMLFQAARGTGMRGMGGGVGPGANPGSTQVPHHYNPSGGGQVRPSALSNEQIPGEDNGLVGGQLSGGGGNMQVSTSKAAAGGAYASIGGGGMMPYQQAGLIPSGALGAAGKLLLGAGAGALIDTGLSHLTGRARHPHTLMVGDRTYVLAPRVRYRVSIARAGGRRCHRGGR